MQKLVGCECAIDLCSAAVFPELGAGGGCLACESHVQRIFNMNIVQIDHLLCCLLSPAKSFDRCQLNPLTPIFSSHTFGDDSRVKSQPLCDSTFSFHFFPFFFIALKWKRNPF